MARNFKSFLDAYVSFAHDGFCPDNFHKWVGFSILAGALERKVSLAQPTGEGTIYHTPNIYVMLVSHPAGGKSTAINRGADLLEDLRRVYNPNFKIVPNQITESALVDIMKITERYEVKGKNGNSFFLPHSSGYFYASEASASALQNVFGDFIATMTEFYDSPRNFRKKLKGEKYTTEIENVCMNLLAGSTFDFLKKIVNEQSVQGGFASRLIYVIQRDRKVREVSWGSASQADTDTKNKLLEDLDHINKLAGPMRPTECFIKRFSEWQPEFDRYLIELNSPRMESIMARKGTNIIKVAMLYSISEGDSMEVNAYHFDRAAEAVDEVYKDNPYVLSQAIINDKTSQAGMSQMIMRALEKGQGCLPLVEVKASVFKHGGQISAFKETLEYMASSGLIGFEGSDRIRLLVNPDSYL